MNAKTSCRWLALGVVSLGVSAQADVFEYSFPASWDGLAPTVTDLGPVGNDANPNNAVLDAAAPPGSANQSINTTDGGMTTQAIDLLENSVVAAAGGFVMSAEFLWDGTNDQGSSILIQKIIDYAGTEFVQIENLDLVNGTADLRFGFNDAPGGLTTQIEANQWYYFEATFSTLGNTVNGDGSLDGDTSLFVNNLTTPQPGVAIVGTANKTDFGDSLDRSIGIGGLSVAPTIIELHGNIHDPSVRLLPEPATAALLGLGALALCRRRA